MKALLFILNYCGIITFAFAGVAKAKKASFGCLKGIFCGVLTTYGGGAFIRDVLLLERKPSILGCPKELLNALIICMAMAVFFYTQKEVKPNPLLFKSIDILGTMAFCLDGTLKGFEGSHNLLIAFLCGVFSSIGGGILTSVIAGYSLKELLLESYLYRLTVLAAAASFLLIILNGAAARGILAVGFLISTAYVAMNYISIRLFIRNLKHQNLTRFHSVVSLNGWDGARNPINLYILVMPMIAAVMQAFYYPLTSVLNRKRQLNLYFKVIILKIIKELKHSARIRARL